MNSGQILSDAKITEKRVVKKARKDFVFTKLEKLKKILPTNFQSYEKD